MPLFTQLCSAAAYCVSPATPPTIVAISGEASFAMLTVAELVHPEMLGQKAELPADATTPPTLPLVAETCS